MKDLQKWALECDNFQNWFKNLGGNIGSDEQMTEAFMRIEAKNVSDCELYQFLANEFEVVEPEILT